MSQETRKPCPKCGCTRIQKAGKVPSVKLGIKKQRFICPECGTSFF